MIDHEKIHLKEFRAKVGELTKEAGASDHVYVLLDRETRETWVNFGTDEGLAAVAMAAAVLKGVAAGMSIEIAEAAEFIAGWASHGKEVLEGGPEAEGPKLAD